MDHPFLDRCRECDAVTSRKFAQAHEGKCKGCAAKAKETCNETSNRGN